MLHLPPNLVVVPVVALLLIYCGLPLAIWMTVKVKKAYPNRPVRADEVSSGPRAYFDQLHPALAALGFEHGGFFAPQGGADAQPYQALWINRRTGQTAIATAVHSTNPAMQVASSFKFSTHFANDTHVMTTNAEGFDVNPWPGLDILHASITRDPSELYQLHLWREAQLAPVNALRHLVAPGDEVEIFVPTNEDEQYGLRRQTSTGRFRTNGQGVNVLTLKGAFAAIWPQLPPMRTYYRSRERVRARRQLNAARANPVAPPVNPPITTEPLWKTVSLKR
jgi:hypothetical protein